MKEKISLAIAILAIIAALVYLAPSGQDRVYDCRMAEWHPDIPPAVKEECRRRMLEHLETQKERLTV